MILRSVAIENFRAVKAAKVSFDPTTVLIGENDCGRSSIMEAIALALGWNTNGGEFQFQPFHVHRPAGQESSPPGSISIVLEFGEGAPGEWEGEGFEQLRAALPGVLGPDRRFWLHVTHGGAAHWSFRSARDDALHDDGPLLAWLRRRMPVFWMSEGMLTARSGHPGRREWHDAHEKQLADQVTAQYRDLLQGTALDVPAAIEGGSAAARQLLLARPDLVSRDMFAGGEVLQEITGKRKSNPSRRFSDGIRNFGSAANQIGLLLLVGSLLRSGGSRVEPGIQPLTLIENPEAHLHPITLASIWSIIDRIRGQKIIATHSGTLLACARLSSARRLTRCAGVVKEWRVPEGSLTAEELRRYAYHLRSRRAAASFARCWLLVEGETEFWLIGELARVCGYDFDSEGVACVEFAQCGLTALIKVARYFGIEWHLLADGDAAGQHYARTAGQFTPAACVQDRISVLAEADLEQCFWKWGYEDVFRRAAYPRESRTEKAAHRNASAKVVIRRAIERYSKPHLAVLLLDEVMDRGTKGVPPVLRRVIETCIRLARREPTRGTDA
jgi:putative ATP-dependent endonuclease of OLD family